MKTITLVIALSAASLVAMPDLARAQTTAPAPAPATAPAAQPAAQPATQAATQPATQPTATLITVRADAKPARDVLEDIARQAKVTLSLPKDLWATDMPLVTVQAVERPFWEVVRDVCRQAKVSVATNARPGTLGIAAPDTRDPWNLDAGPILLRQTSITLTRRVDYAAGDARVLQPTINLQLACEPSMRLLRSDPVEQVAIVVDGMPGPVRPVDPPASSVRAPYYSPVANVVWSASIPIPELPAKAQRIDSIRFNVRAVLQTRMQTWDLDDLSREQTREIGGWKLTFKKRASMNETVDSIEIAVAGRPAGMPENVDPFSGLRILDKDGVSLMRAGYSSAPNKTNQTVQFVRRTTTGEPAGEPVKLQWDVPSDTSTISIPVELKDIELDPK